MRLPRVPMSTKQPLLLKFCNTSAGIDVSFRTDGGGRRRTDGGGGGSRNSYLD